MTFGEFLRTVPEAELIQGLTNLYDETFNDEFAGYIAYQMKAYRTLLSLEPVPCNMGLLVHYLAKHTMYVVAGEHLKETGYYDDTDDGECYNILGMSFKAEDHMDAEWNRIPTFAIEFIPWVEWLSMKMSIISLFYPRGDVLANIIWEMTFSSNDPEEIKERYERLRGLCEECDTSS